MSADFTIHVFGEGELTEQDFAILKGSTLGSAYWAGFVVAARTLDDRMAIYDKVDRLPRFNVGEVSWLKAAVLVGGEGDYVPGPIEKLNDILEVRDHPVIDDDLIARVLGAFEVPNTSVFDLDERDMVPRLRRFLDEHRGKRAFSVSW